MSRIKSIIQKLFPPKQKVLNIFKITYLVLLIISLPEIFVYVGGEAVLGIWNTLAWFALWAVFIVFMLALPMYYKSKKKRHSFYTTTCPFNIFIFYCSKITSLYCRLVGYFLFFSSFNNLHPLE